MSGVRGTQGILVLSVNREKHLGSVHMPCTRDRVTNTCGRSGLRATAKTGDRLGQEAGGEDWAGSVNNGRTLEPINRGQPFVLAGGLCPDQSKTERRVRFSKLASLNAPNQSPWQAQLGASSSYLEYPTIHAPVLLVQVDATIESELAKDHGVNGYPTLKWFIDGEPTDYNGPRDA